MPDRWLQSLRGFLIYCRGLLSGLLENWTWRTLNLVCEAWELNTRRSVSPQTFVNSVASILGVCPFSDLFIVFSADWLRFFCWVNSKSHQWRCKIIEGLCLLCCCAALPLAAQGGITAIYHYVSQMSAIQAHRISSAALRLLGWTVSRGCNKQFYSALVHFHYAAILVDKMKNLEFLWIVSELFKLLLLSNKLSESFWKNRVFGRKMKNLFSKCGREIFFSSLNGWADLCLQLET